MTIASWPVTLPVYAQEQGLGDELPSQTMESTLPGKPAVRRRHANASRPIDLTFWMTNAQVATFENFFLNTIKHGSLPFTMTDPIAFNSRTFQFRDGPPEYRVVGHDIIAVSMRVMRVA